MAVPYVFQASKHFCITWTLKKDSKIFLNLSYTVVNVLLQALIHGLNRHYYSISINYRKNELEQKMLLNLHKKSWMDGLMLQDYKDHCKVNESTVNNMLDLAKNYNKVTWIYLTYLILIGKSTFLLIFVLVICFNQCCHTVLPVLS